MTARAQTRSAGSSDDRMFRYGQSRTRGQALGHGVLVGCAIATGMLVLALGIGAAYGQWDQGMAFCLSYIIAGVAGGLFQQAWFNPNVSLKLKYPARLAGFAVTYFIVLLACAWIGGWIPQEASMSAWIGFAVIFAAIFAALTIYFSIRFRKQGGTYNELLAQYRAKRDTERNQVE